MGTPRKPKEPQTEEVLEVDSAGETDDLLQHAQEDDGPECSDSHVQEDSDENDEIEDCPSQAMLGTPLYKLEQEYDRSMQMNLEDLDLKPAVYIQEGSELMSQLCDELAMIPELNDLSPECDITQADVGEPGRTTPDEDRKLRTVQEYHRTIFLGDGNAAPAPARGVVCDLDVGDANPVALRPSSIAPHLMRKVYELLKKLLKTNLIENSGSPWASPIVIVLKKNGDIRMCIDYRVVNGFIKLSNYPLPLIDDLLIGVETAMWFMSLDMASGFWAVTMTERAKLISAFVCPFGHFQWVRMPFGLENAPLIYQAVINICLWGFARLPPEEEKVVDPDMLVFLGLDVKERGGGSEREKSGSKVALLEHHGEPAQKFDKLTILYLSHEISAERLRATPKIAKGVQNLPFPKTLK
ncbi:unnamed protein product [Phytophthora fragariaefolia]|uniref:Unnamed protein product n=1 Tax=Phytophthora fragariaefolia TaxID=1490495 RepID=A0A9W6XWG0_9STRA|nr:unnamed protein product [Phytophthora fragariaefolia]